MFQERNQIRDTGIDANRFPVPDIPDVISFFDPVNQKLWTTKAAYHIFMLFYDRISVTQPELSLCFT